MKKDYPKKPLRESEYIIVVDNKVLYRMKCKTAEEAKKEAQSYGIDHPYEVFIKVAGNLAIETIQKKIGK